MADMAVSGTMVGAVLESAGYLYQSYLLDEMANAFKGTLGGFIYLIGVVVAVFGYASRGNYRLTAWLLIGPPLFFSFVLPRTETPESRWRFALQDRNQDEVTREVQRIAGNVGIAGQARVSTVFARYNKLVSATTQEMAKIINNGKKDTDKMFIFKGELYGQLFAKGVEEADFRDFVRSVFFTQCGRFIDAARDVGDPNVDAAKKKAAQEIMDQFGTNKNVKLTPGAAKYLAAKNMAILEFIGFGQYANLEFLANQQRRRTFTCEDIWKLTHQGLKEYGKRVVKTIKDTATVNDIDADLFMRQLTKAALGRPVDNVDELALVAAKYSLRNELFRGSHTGIINQIADQGRSSLDVEMGPEDDVVQVERARVAQTEWSELTRMLSNASNLPYYQGLGLFFLAIAFPFFALLLLVPGKHPAVIMWFLLWLWLKSWDVGYAVAMQVDDILFTIFSFMKRVDPAHEQLSPQLTEAIAVLHNTDPTFSMTTYYNIMAVLLYSIPIISSQLLLGGLSGGAGIVSGGMKTAADWFAGSAQATSNQLAVRNLKFEGMDRKMQQAQLAQDLNSGQVGSDGKRIPRYGLFSPDEMAAFEHGDAKTRQGMMMRYLPKDPAAAHRQSVAQMGSEWLGLGLSSAVGRMGDSRDGRRGHDNNSAAAFERARVLASRAGMAAELSNQDVASMNSPLFGNGVGRRRLPNAGMNAWQRLYRHVVSAAGKAGQTITQAELDELMSNLDAETAADMAWSVYDTMYSSEIQDIAAVSRLYGALDVPWTSNSSGEVAESDRELVEFRNRVNVLTAYLKAAEDFLRDLGKENGILDKNESWTKDRDFMKRAREDMLKNGIPEDIVNQLDFFDPNFKKNMENIFKDDGSGLKDLYRRLWEDVGKQLGNQRLSMPNFGPPTP